MTGCVCVWVGGVGGGDSAVIDFACVCVPLHNQLICIYLRSPSSLPLVAVWLAGWRAGVVVERDKKKRERGRESEGFNLVNSASQVKAGSRRHVLFTQLEVRLQGSRGINPYWHYFPS